jgi:hypothetical protein
MTEKKVIRLELSLGYGVPRSRDNGPGEKTFCLPSSLSPASLSPFTESRIRSGPASCISGTTKSPSLWGETHPPSKWVGPSPSQRNKPIPARQPAGFRSELEIRKLSLAGSRAVQVPVRLSGAVKLACPAVSCLTPNFPFLSSLPVISPLFAITRSLTHVPIPHTHPSLTFTMATLFTRQAVASASRTARCWRPAAVKVAPVSRALPISQRMSFSQSVQRKI